MKTLIIDNIIFSPMPQSIRLSNEHPEKRYIVQGILQRADAKNQNGRIYPKTILLRLIKKYNLNYVSQKMALGLLDHSDSSVINLKNVSHNIIKVY